MPEHALTPLVIAIAAVGGYLLGSIPFGMIATRLGGAGDLRQIGSGNIGATNVLRTGRRDLAAITLIGDAAKGAVAALLCWWLFKSKEAAVIAGGAAFLGHLFPVWLRFQGGKGVATFYGVLFAVTWPVGLLAGAAWLAMAAILRISSLASLTAAAFAPVFAFATHQGQAVIILTVFMGILIFIRHHANIGRLLRNEEPRIGAKKAGPPPSSDSPAA